MPSIRMVTKLRNKISQMSRDLKGYTGESKLYKNKNVGLSTQNLGEIINISLAAVTNNITLDNELGNHALCIKNLSESITIPAIVNQNITLNHKADSDSLCNLCNRNTKNTIFLPCGHLVYCNLCIDTLKIKIGEKLTIKHPFSICSKCKHYIRKFLLLMHMNNKIILEFISLINQ